ncbi:MAG: class I SAM-dependent methyltransferase [Victivallales bacterium]
MNCRVCGKNNLEPVIDLGEQPWGNDFLTKGQVGHEMYYPLCTVFCHDCHTLQLNYTVPKEKMFANHTYLSGITRSLSDHFKMIAESADRSFFADRTKKAALDIGSNDGTFLQHLKNLHYDVLGVESATIPTQIANAKGIPTCHKFFNMKTASEINRKFELINASGVLFHLEELHSVLEGIRFLLANDGIFIIQFLYLKSIVENGAFDQIYHEHLLYYTLITLENLLQLHGLSIFDAYLTPIHGGSMIAYVTHQGSGKEKSQRLLSYLTEEAECRINDADTFKDFSYKIQLMKEKNLEQLDKWKRMGKTIFGLGAPVKGNTLLNTFGIGRNYLDCLTERNSLRKGLFAPGSHLEIVMEDELTQPPDCYYVLAWNFKKEILARHAAAIQNGVEFYFPVEQREG